MIFSRLIPAHFKLCFTAAAVMFFAISNSQAQCVVFNEIMINGGGSNDGSNSPNTEEWVELYNTCDFPVDMSCFVMTDGDFTVTFPTNSIIQPHDFFTIGSSNAGFAVDLNWGTCNCEGGSAVGVFTNGTEQLVLVDENETIVDAVIWGGGQLPVTINSTNNQGCSAVTLNLNNNNTSFTSVPPTGSNSENGCTVGLTCNGGDIWQVMCGADITPGTSNSAIVSVVDFTSSNQTICTGDCIDFTDLSVPNSTGWTWTFEGALTNTSSTENPTGICYDAVGIFDVTLQVTNFCGTDLLTLNDYIQVDSGVIPVITADGPLTFCEGESVTLEASGPGPYNWTQDGVTIAGANAQQYIATESGTYNATNNSPFCPGESNSIVVDVTPATDIDFSSSVQMICTGGCIQFTDLSSAVSDSWSWTFEGATTSSSTDENPLNICYDVAGTYDVTLEITNSCGTHSLVFSNYIDVQDNQALILSADGSTIICDGESVTLNTSGVGPFEWTLDGATIVGASTAQYNATQPGDYVASTINETCPATSNTITVVVQNAIPVSISPGNDVAICESTVQLQASTVGSVQWLLNGAPIVGATQPTYDATLSGDYQFESSAPGLCPALSDQIHVSLNNSITLNVTLSSDTICEGETATITAIGFFDDILWSNGETTDAITVSQSGTYNAHVSFSTCQADSTVRLFVVELPLVNAGEDLFSPCDGLMQLSGTGEGGLSWYFDNVLLGDSSDVLIESPLKNVVYSLHANNYGCISTDDVLVEADCISIYIPNAFTPDNDGVNDVFKVEARGVVNYEFFIFNRWGDVVFHSTDPDDVWTGGKHDYFVPDGVYTYLVKGVNTKYEDILDSKHSRGTITVIR